MERQEVGTLSGYTRASFSSLQSMKWIYEIHEKTLS